MRPSALFYSIVKGILSTTMCSGVSVYFGLGKSRFIRNAADSCCSNSNLEKINLFPLDVVVQLCSLY